jgi:acyl-CoA thioesterase FadM
MMLRLRFLWLILSSFWKKPLGFLDESVLNLIVFPNDVDITKISNDRYTALMDLGRIDIGFRVGLRKAMTIKRWMPVSTFNTIRFRYPLKIFQKYQLKTKVIWWGETTFYWEQIFERKGRVIATGLICATLFNKNGKIPSNVVIEEAGQSVIKPEEPKVIAKLREIESLVHETQKD